MHNALVHLEILEYLEYLALLAPLEIINGQLIVINGEQSEQF